MIGAFRLNTLASSGGASPAWILRYYGSGSEALSCACADTAGNYYTALLTLSPTQISTTGDIMVVKINAAGAIQWQRRLGLTATAPQPKGIVLDDYGNVHVSYSMASSAIFLTAINASTGAVITSTTISAIGGQTTVNAGTTENGLYWLSSLSSLSITANAGTVAANSFAAVGILPYNNSTSTYTIAGLSFMASNYASYNETAWTGMLYNSTTTYSKAFMMSSFPTLTNSNSGSVTTRYLTGVNAISSVHMTPAIPGGGSDYNTTMVNAGSPSGIAVTKINFALNATISKLSTSVLSTGAKVFTNDASTETYLLASNGTTPRALYLFKFDGALNQVWQLKIACSTLSTLAGTPNNIIVKGDSLYASFYFNFSTQGGNQSTDLVTFKLPTDGSKTGTYTVSSTSWTISTSTDVTWSNNTVTFNTLALTESTNSATTSTPALTNNTNGLSNVLVTV